MRDDTRALIENFQHKHIYLDQETCNKFSVKNKSPFAVIEPENVDQIAELLAECRNSGSTVNIWGNGQHQILGNPLDRYDITLSTRLLNSVTEFEPDNLTISVGSGMTYNELQRIVGEKGLFLPINPDAGDATLGGLVSANHYSSWIEGYGTFRDLVLGGRAVLADGSKIRFGGKTVKNVAGYDMAKLFIGAMGTLGVVTELTLKLSPIPEIVLVVEMDINSPKDLLPVQKLVNTSALPLLAFNCVEKEGKASIVIECGCISDEKAFYQKKLEAMFSTEKLKVLSWDEYLQSIQPTKLDIEKEALLKSIVPVSKVADVLEQLHNDAGFSAQQIESYPGKGIVLARIDKNSFTLETLQELRNHAHNLEGKFLCFNGPDFAEKPCDAWDVKPDQTIWHRKLKQEFDPQGVFVGGRFIDGI